MNAITVVSAETSAHLYCLSTRETMSSLVRGADVDQGGQQQELWGLVQQDQIIIPQTIIVHPAAIYLEGCRVVMLLLVEQRCAL